MAHVTFIHGISNKPASDALLAIWRRTLAEAEDALPLGDLGVTSSLVYWADLMYASPDADVAAHEGVLENTPQAIDASGGAEPYLVDETYGPDPSKSSLRRPSDLCDFKPGTDVILVGHAHAPRSGATHVDVSMRVGPVAKTVRAFGPRCVIACAVSRESRSLSAPRTSSVGQRSAS